MAIHRMKKISFSIKLKDTAPFKKEDMPSVSIFEATQSAFHTVSINMCLYIFA